MKKNKLYTVNEWNQPAFMPKNRFEVGGPIIPNNLDYRMKLLQGSVDNERMANYLSQKPASGSSFGSTAAAVGSALGSVNTGDPRGMWDTLDPVYHLADGRESAVGNAMSDAGVSLTQAGLSSGNPYLMVAGAGAKVIGGLTNAAFGIKTNQAALNRANNSISTLNGFVSNAGSFDAIQGPEAVATEKVYEGGWFSGSKARRKNRALQERLNNAKSFAFRSVDNNINNLAEDQMNNALANYSAYGGPLDMLEDTTNMGAIEYGFMSDYLTEKRRQNELKNKLSGMATVPAFMPNSYAIGGDLQTNGADWSTGMTHINAGKSHEENPNEGVQMGVDNEGTPNLVEENETIFNDYVYSNRILADEATKQLFRLPKKKDITFAEISKKLEKEIAERPNDPISKSAFEKQMAELADEQERQKQEMEAERAKAAFEALTPEEQTAVMQEVSARQNLAAQEQAIAEQQAMQQPTPEEAAMMQQQQMLQADGSEANMPYTPEELSQLQQNVGALGGRLVKAGDVEPNKFAVGGRKTKRMAKKYNEDWFKQMAKSLGISDADMESFTFDSRNPEANLIAFNQIYRNSQYNKARDTYRKGQRQSKRNELFGDKGLYSYSDDKSKIYKARTNNSDRVGWINNDYTGAVDTEGNMLGFLSQEDYDKLKPEEKEAYRRINERAGDRMYDYNGRVIRDLYNGTEDELLNSFDTDYDKGFKWDDRDAQTVQYPIDMEHSNASYMRYIPAIGGAIGLGYDLLSSPDYSRPQAIIDAALSTSIPEQVQSHYIGNYLTYRPLDIWYQQNALNAQSRATDRALLNNSSPSRMSGLLANGYNSQIASGNLFRQAQEYNDVLKQKVEDFNRGTNIFNANADMDSQKINATLRQQAGRLGLQGLMTGYGMMDDIDARRQASMSANLTNVLQSLGNIGEEAYDEDRLRWLERTGTLKSGTLSANGGKLKKKKRGLTI